MIIKIPAPLTGVRVASRAMFLAYEASDVVGLGILQARSGVTEGDVWHATTSHLSPGHADGDYVFGRMMKLSIDYADDMVDVSDLHPRIDYQSWCGKYPTRASLIEQAIASLSAAVA